jgi:hypothetical protein
MKIGPIKAMSRKPASNINSTVSDRCCVKWLTKEARLGSTAIGCGAASVFAMVYPNLQSFR